VTVTFSRDKLYSVSLLHLVTSALALFSMVDDQIAWKVVWAHKLWSTTLMIQTSLADSIR
jgi:hypothetical protein